MILEVMTCEFSNPYVGAAGLRVSKWLLGFGCACWGPSAAGAESAGCLVGIRPLSCYSQLREQNPEVTIPKGTRDLQSFIMILAAARCSLNPSVMQVCCLLICQICWLRCKWIGTDRRDFRIAKHTKAGIGSVTSELTISFSEC